MKKIHGSIFFLVVYNMTYQVLVHLFDVVGDVNGWGGGSDGGGQQQVLGLEGGLQLLYLFMILSLVKIYFMHMKGECKMGAFSPVASAFSKMLQKKLYKSGENFVV